ncbi:MAG: heme anaerobic degradation radical SAM methyltransferase ChuW/HutW [Deltaproteobacteria bacterium]|nr:heme anaerobic degradation radical SAM methyltransferase ChuW/HutW [Deltaproteobacteria bacterium]
MQTGRLGDHHARLGGDPIRDAFARRAPLVPWRGQRPVPADALEEAWQRLIGTPAPRGKRVAYVNVPFCANHCLFCGFYRGPAQPARIAGYASLVIEELERERAAAGVARAPVHALYLGGGTPSALPAGELHHLLRALRGALPLAPDCEITVEGRWLGFDAEKVDACLEAGANRFSIGVQSFDTAVRRSQGRRASRDELLRFLAELVDRDRAAIVADLLIGLPGQTPDTWQDDLRACIDLELDGVDLYPLNVYPATPLAGAIAAGKSGPALPLPEQGALYREGARVLEDAGWRQISNSHWARATRERNLYNLLIKQGADCLGYGAGAGGSLAEHSYALAAELEAYAALVRAGRKPLRAIREPDADERLQQHLAAQLEVGRLDLATLGPDARERAGALVGQWQRAGLLEGAGPRLRLTVAGRFWAPNLARGLRDVLHPDEPRRTTT